MIDSWKLLATSIDALKLRERALLFLSLVAVCAALVDWLWLAPARLAYRQVTQTFAQQNVELRHLREELQVRASQPDPVRLAREDLARLNGELAQSRRSIAALTGASQGTMSLAEVLVPFLRRYPNLTLVRTGNIGPDPAGSGAATELRPVATGAPTLLRQGLELTVAGPYADLVRYVQTLETAMPEMRWGPLKLLAEKQPPELSLQVFLVRPLP